MISTNKKKIVNDPVHGFININYPLIYDLIEHPFFQRLRNIKQLGLTYLVYPGATHSRLQHALGAMHLLDMAIETLRSKGQIIMEHEAEAACAAILLHDIGHGPFSHALEYSIANGVSHETISRCLMEDINREFNGRLTLAIDIFDDKYPKRFLHQLISGQLDMDRMDYLKRDSFFSGVTEGAIGSDRIIKMLNVVDDELVVEAKGIYSIEKFLIARRLMYWQVYLHKTVVAAEQTLIKMLKRAKELAKQDLEIDASPALKYFLLNDISNAEFKGSLENNQNIALQNFALLDDSDIMVSAKLWINSKDPVLSTLAKMITNRKLLSVTLKNTPFDTKQIDSLRVSFIKLYPELKEFADYFVFSDSLSISAYQPGDESIKILYNNGQLTDIAEASDMLNAKALSNEVKKYFICYPKELRNI
ncbi:MAG TPA: HD domain-containing protein [Tenuifilaceae bacterium]|nr:HD domain-containing protein [Tenuifilaceae bacterium]